MKVRLLKEARALAPYFALAVALGTLPCWVWKEDGSGIAVFGFGLGCALMAALSFGAEFQLRTFPLLLSQPVSRGVIWREKMFPLAAAMVAAMLATGAAMVWVSRETLLSSDHALALVAILFCAGCGVPAFTLATGSGIAGMSFGALVPPLLVGLGLKLNESFLHVAAGERLAGGILAAYCASALALGYLQLRRLRLAARAVGGVDSWRPFERLLPGAMAARAGRRQGISNLVRKEIRLQGAAFVLAALFGVVAIVAAALSLPAPGTARVVLDGSCVICVFMLPLLAGALAVAEERGWGMAEWHLTLPVPAWKQWAVKVAVAMCVGVGLAFVLPTLILFVYAGFTVPAGSTEALVLMLSYTVIAVSAAAYAGTFSGSSLRAMLAAISLVVGLGLCWLLGVQTMQKLMEGVPYLPGRPSRTIEDLAIAGSTLVIALLVLGFRSFQARTNWQGHLLEILALFAFVYGFTVRAVSWLFAGP